MVSPARTGWPATGRRELSAVQRWLWSDRAAGVPPRAELGAVRLSGQLDQRRLAGALAEVVDALPILRAGFTSAGGRPAMTAAGPGPAVIRRQLAGPDQRCVTELRSDRDRRPDPLREPLVRFHLLQRSAGELVVGLVADPLMLDRRSVYLVLGALLQAYVGRLRPARYPGLEALPGPAGAAAGHRDWWSRRLRAWQPGSGAGSGSGSGAGGGPVAGTAGSRQLRLTPSRWRELTAAAGPPGGNAGWLAVIALLTWWRRTRLEPDRPVVFAGTLDLRDYLGLGPVPGPLTDRIAFPVELDGVAGLTFRDLVRRVHAGVLDAVVHYLPYGDLVALGRELGTPVPPHPSRPWDLAVHYCPFPPASAHTRGERTLAGEGLSIELFQEAELAAGGPTAASLDIHLAESGAGMAVVANLAGSGVAGAAVDELLAGIDALVDRVAADPERPLSRL